MTSSRDTILSRLRAARRPFPNAAPRPAAYLPVTEIDDTTTEGLLARFTEELERLTAHVYPVEGDDAAIAQVRALLGQFSVDHVLAWDFQYIPVAGLEEALRADGCRMTFPDLHADDRAQHAALIKTAGAGIIGADAAAATTGTLIVSTAPGKGRMPSVLPPVLIAIITIDQLVPRLESWLAAERASGMAHIRDSSNLCFITGPSRTGDIEMALVLGVHGPGEVHVIVKRETALDRLVADAQEQGMGHD